MNAFYRESNAEYIHDRKREMAEQGYQQGDPPFGYERGPDKVFVVVADEAAAVESIYAGYLAGDSSTSLAKDLNTSGRRTRRGRLWTRDSIHGILRNPTYAGLVHFNRRKTRNLIGPGKHAAIVTEACFAAVQELATGRRRRGSSHPFGRDPLPLTGVTFDRWGHRLAGAGRGLMRCYANRMLDGSACLQSAAHVETLEAQIGAYVSAMVIPDEAVAAIVAEALAMLAPPAGPGRDPARPGQAARRLPCRSDRLPDLPARDGTAQRPNSRHWSGPSATSTSIAPSPWSVIRAPGGTPWNAPTDAPMSTPSSHGWRSKESRSP